MGIFRRAVEKFWPFSSSEQVTSPMQRSCEIDIVGLDAKTGVGVLSLIETRPWTEGGTELRDLQEKLNGYLDYIESGRLAEDYPQLAGKPIQFRLQTKFPIGPREQEFISEVRRRFLEPRRIEWKTSLIGSWYEPGT